jgi:lipopolysaccharide export system protein LptC
MTTTNSHRPHRGKGRGGYAKAARHSRRVLMLKLAFPIAALFAIVAFVGSTMISRALPEGASIGNAAISGGKLIMSDPVMTGPVNGNQNYSITAARAIQELSAPSVIRLEDIVADFPVNGAETALLDAISGIYNRDEEFLVLDQPFTVTTEGGLTARLENANIDIGKGVLKTDKKVSIETDQARIVAESLVMKDNGKEVVFERDVHVTLNPGAVRSSASKVQVEE